MPRTPAPWQQASLLKLGLATGQSWVRRLRSFPGLAHRMEPVASYRGVAFVNDSKATNADAAARALGSYRSASIGSPVGTRKAMGSIHLTLSFRKSSKLTLSERRRTGSPPRWRAMCLMRGRRRLSARSTRAARDALADGLEGACVLLVPGLRVLGPVHVLRSARRCVQACGSFTFHRGAAARSRE
jgi:UDP-N-acetylmuramoylalanine--D-glutamate ligase